MKYDARIRKIETAIYQIAGNAAIIVYPDREEQTDLLDYYLNLIYASAKGEIPDKPKEIRPISPSGASSHLKEMINTFFKQTQ